MWSKKQLTKEQASKKIKHFCAYQERCHSEVKEVLYSYGLRKTETEELMAELIETNYLNEERFALQYAGGKFRMKQWGRKKIQYELQQKRVGPLIIKIALKQIDDEDYQNTLQKLADTKWESLAGEQYLVRQAKTNNYLLQKGYEMSLIQQVVNNIRSKAAKL